MSQLFEKHRETLDRAAQAIHAREYWSAYPEVPSGKVYGESARADGEAAFKSYLNQPFAMGGTHPGRLAGVGEERSPYGFSLGVKYPRASAADLVAASRQAGGAWARASIEQRLGVCLEILQRLNRRSFEIAFAVMHTSGQGFMMAFQAGGPHAQDRALEALAYAWHEMRRTPAEATWTKQVSKTDSVTLRKKFRIVPRGVAVSVGCSTFPTWNSYPAIFASLATGNSVIIKPHPGAVLPLAITVSVAREVLSEQGFDPNVVTLAADSADAPLTAELVTHPDVKIVDYTGGTAFGEWIEANALQATVYTEKAGINSTVIESLDDLKAVTGNLAFSLCLYSGQMCTTPQNVFIPRDGVHVGGRPMTFDEVAGAIVKAVDWLLSDPARAQEILGAIQNDLTASRIEQAAGEGAAVLRASTAHRHEHFPEARVRSPLILKAEAADEERFAREMFGPIVYIVAVDDAAQGLALAANIAKQRGAITLGVYSTDAGFLAMAEDVSAEAGAPLSCNLVGPIYVNQSAAFSDFHVSGANPSGNATLTDGAFVAGRFRVVQSRIPGG